MLLTSECTHGVKFHGVCALCGVDVESDEQDSNEEFVQIIHGSKEIRIAKKEAERLEKETTNRLIQARKLSLVIDLDQTILHATVDTNIGLWKIDPDSPNYLSLKNVVEFTLPDSNCIYYVKLRPGLESFLKTLNELYELHIYTMGTRNYAKAVVKAIDPDQSLFHDRIISRDDNVGLQKDLARIFPCDDSMVVVIDDRLDVWKWHQNIVPVRPYNFFVTGDLNAPERLGKTAVGGIENHAFNIVLDDSDIELIGIQNILLELHTKFYSFIDKGESTDVKDLLTEMKSKILKDVVISFSGLVPLMFDASATNIWKLAESFGAKCIDEIDSSLTHLVAVAKTEKLKKAFESSFARFVKPDWLFDSVYHWERQDEIKYLLDPEMDQQTLLSKAELDQQNRLKRKLQDEESSSMEESSEEIQEQDDLEDIEDWINEELDK